MSMIERYILRIAAVAFFACLFALTAIIWLTQALRELNLVTGKGQTILLFLEVTMLSVPALVMIIAPLALFIAILYTLNRLNSDSELIVMNAAGLSPMIILGLSRFSRWSSRCLSARSRSLPCPRASGRCAPSSRRCGRMW